MISEADFISLVSTGLLSSAHCRITFRLGLNVLHMFLERSLRILTTQWTDDVTSTGPLRVDGILG